ncbi:MAG: DNA methyltransferase [Verrucomicrobiales bacterium]
MSDDASTPAADLPTFLKKHVRPYDPATDDYERPPFAVDIKEGKNDPIYNAHSYHTKVPPRSIVPYILHYTQPGDVVLDPFCGSGMTGVAARMCSQVPADILERFPELKERVGPRACILNDLSPAACHIAYNYNTPVDVAELRSEFERIKEAVKYEFTWLYGTEHYEPAVGVYAPTQPEVATRLRNPPANVPQLKLLDESERTWRLLSREEVERRLGYPVDELPRDEDRAKLDVTAVEQWVCIPATIQYTIWSDVYRCEGFVTIEEPTGKISMRGKNAGKPMVQKKRVARGCGMEMILWDVAVDHQSGEVRDVFHCPHCGQDWKKAQLTKIRSQPRITDYEFLNPNSKRRRLNRRSTAAERRLIETIEAKPVPCWSPQMPWDETREMWRGGHREAGIRTVSDFYTRRNLWAVARLWDEAGKAESERLRKMLRFAITAFGMRASRLSRVAMSNFVHGGGGPVMSALLGTLYVPSFSVESNVGLLFRRREDDLAQIAYLFAGVRGLGTVVLRGSATNLTALPDASVDYIFADPPFGSNIFYSDCSFLWEGWLDEFTDISKEAVWNKSRTAAEGGKSLDEYGGLMSDAFAEMFRVLKPGRWATIEFNNSDGRVFDAIKRGIIVAGFEIANMLLLDKEQKSFKQVKGEKGEEDVVDKDVLFNVHKPAAVRREARSEDSDLEQQVAEAVRQHLATLPERITAESAKYSDDHRTTATINSMLMNTLIPRGVSVERLNLPFIERVCARFFRKIGQRWYLRGEAVGGNGGELVTEEVAIADELTAIAWLRQKLQPGPKLIGELKPVWMRATGMLSAALSQSVVLEALLRQNFWRDVASNRWREPTPEEREKINDDRALRVLHDADRLAAGTLGRTPASRELCEWIAVLFDTCKELAEGDAEAAAAHPGFDAKEAYQLIVKLSHRLVSEDVEPGAFSDAQKQARVAGQRLAAVVESAEATTSKRPRRPEDDNQLMLEF